MPDCRQPRSPLDTAETPQKQRASGILHEPNDNGNFTLTSTHGAAFCGLLYGSDSSEGSWAFGLLGPLGISQHVLVNRSPIRIFDPNVREPLLPKLVRYLESVLNIVTKHCWPSRA
jgi:hypothetical protein